MFIPGWSNGRTPDFGSGNLGSNPSPGICGRGETVNAVGLKPIVARLVGSTPTVRISSSFYLLDKRDHLW